MGYSSSSDRIIEDSPQTPILRVYHVDINGNVRSFYLDVSFDKIQFALL